MGFIMQRGTGTDEVMECLYRAFYLNIEDTAADFVSSFAPGAVLADAARDLGIRPRDPQQNRHWKKWLNWLSNTHPPKHEELRRLFFECLTSTPPTPLVVDWQEDKTAKKEDPPNTSVSNGTALGRQIKVLSIKTCHHSKL